MDRSDITRQVKVVDCQATFGIVILEKILAGGGTNWETPDVPFDCKDAADTSHTL